LAANHWAMAGVAPPASGIGPKGAWAGVIAV